MVSATCKYGVLFSSNILWVVWAIKSPSEHRKHRQFREIGAPEIESKLGFYKIGQRTFDALVVQVAHRHAQAKMRPDQIADKQAGANL